MKMLNDPDDRDELVLLTLREHSTRTEIIDGAPGELHEVACKEKQAFHRRSHASRFIRRVKNRIYPIAERRQNNARDALNTGTEDLHPVPEPIRCGRKNNPMSSPGGGGNSN